MCSFVVLSLTSPYLITQLNQDQPDREENVQKKYPAVKPSYESTSVPRLYFGKLNLFAQH